ncbi:MAG TPA: hypothetical protein VGF77_16585 [Allosphingosinicella sp.]|jgi:hypothetical protein
MGKAVERKREEQDMSGAARPEPIPLVPWLAPKDEAGRPRKRPGLY